MQSAFRTVALIGKYQSRDVAAALAELAGFLTGRGVAVLLEASTAEAADLPALAGIARADYERIGAEADLAVIVGGDGTMLNTARRLAAHDVPMVGVNQGRLGFMTDIARNEIAAGMSAILDGRFTRERRLLLAARVLRDGAVLAETVALNDVVVSKGELGRMIELGVEVDDELLHVLRADGLIVATPTGSTAYALSANGPILHPAVAGLAIVPLCPHALTHRPITIPDSSRVDITLVPPHDALVHFDGQMRVDARAGDRVEIRRSPHGVTLLHPPGYRYFAMLREKLHWSSVPRS